MLDDETRPVVGNESKERPAQRRLPVKPLKKAAAAWPALAACGAFVCLAGSVMTPTMGSTRSVRLKWDGRAAEVDRAAAASESCDGAGVLPGKE